MIMKDRISEFYKGEFGTSAMKKQKKRIDWILKNIQGSHVLDIGCSQGIIPILIGRAGRKVVGIDISEEAILYGKKDLSSENETTRNMVTLIKQDFLRWNTKSRFDTIIITEVLEHYQKSNEILEKAYSHLNGDGKVIITVPFGINPHPDHKRTVYLSEIYEELYPFFFIKEVKFIENWIGFTGYKKKNIQKNIADIYVPIEVIKEAEKGFYQMEQRHLKIKRNLNKELVKLKEQEEHGSERKE
ncbi:class I SAM-dependent methyltransferase [Cytobacillus firmus]